MTTARRAQPPEPRWTPCAEHGGRHQHARVGRARLTVEAFPSAGLHEARVAIRGWTACAPYTRPAAAKRAAVRMARRMLGGGRR